MSQGFHTHNNLTQLYADIQREQEQLRRVSLAYEKPHRRPVPTRIAVLVYAIGLACALALILGAPYWWWLR